MNIKVISLKGSDRRKDFITRNGHIDFQFFDAINGKDLPVETINDKKLINWENLNYTSGAIGNALSHLKLWNEVIDTNEPLTIMEDDAIVRLDFIEKQKFIFNQIPNDWDIVFWSYNYDTCLITKILDGATQSTIVFSQDMLRESVNKFRNSTDAVMPLKLILCYGISGYSISPKGAKKYKDICFPLTHKTWDMHLFGQNYEIVNAALDGIMFEGHKQFNAYVCFPSIVVTTNEKELSQVQTKTTD